MNRRGVLQLFVLASDAVISAASASRTAQATGGEVQFTKEIQICDLFRRLDAYAGKYIAVRGIYRFSTELGGLYSEGCEKPLILDGAPRAQALNTEFVAKTPEQQSELAHFNSVVKDIAKGGGRQAIHVTLVGTLVTRNPELHRLGQHKGARMFGHLGIYPAQLRVDGVKNITIEDNSRTPSNMELKE